MRTQVMNSQVTGKTIWDLRKGSHEAFEQVFRSYYTRIQVFIAGFVKSDVDAEELTEELFVNLWINRTEIDVEKSFGAYLHTIAYNMVMNHLKRKCIHNDYLTRHAEQKYTHSSEEELIARETSHMLEHAIERMPAQRKRIFLLSRKEGLKNEDIAARLQTTKRNVESQLSLALKELRKLATSVYTLIVFLFALSVSLIFILTKNDGMIEVVTAEGETQQITLPDGTEVRLQAGSRLTYPRVFAPEMRLLRLNGEAFFSVAKDRNKAFVVETGALKVQVLGTKFNLRAYPEDDNITTTLMQGGVEVITDSGKSIKLTPGEQLVYNRVTRETKLNKLPSADESAKAGETLFFDDVPLSEILRSIERRFDVRIRHNPGLLRERYTVRFHNNDNLDTVIAVLEETVDDYSFKRQANEIVVVYGT